MPGAGLVRGRRETNTHAPMGRVLLVLPALSRSEKPGMPGRPCKGALLGLARPHMGRAEHAVLHLLYARFWHRFLHEEGHLEASRALPQALPPGLIMGDDGEKMSKSRGNVVIRTTSSAATGQTPYRSYLMFHGASERCKPWNSQGIQGIFRSPARLAGLHRGPTARSPRKSWADGGGRETRSCSTDYSESDGGHRGAPVQHRHFPADGVFQPPHPTEALFPGDGQDLLQLLAPYARIWRKSCGSPGREAIGAERGWADYDPAKLVEGPDPGGRAGQWQGCAGSGGAADLPKEEILVLAREPERVQAHLAGQDGPPRDCRPQQTSSTSWPIDVMRFLLLLFALVLAPVGLLGQSGGGRGGWGAGGGRGGAPPGGRLIESSGPGHRSARSDGEDLRRPFPYLLLRDRRAPPDRGRGRAHLLFPMGC